MTKINIKGNLQSRALKTLQTYLTAHPDEARALAESIFIDLLKHLTITQIEEWERELDIINELSVSWEAETETEL